MVLGHRLGLLDVGRIVDAVEAAEAFHQQRHAIKSLLLLHIHLLLSHHLRHSVGSSPLRRLCRRAWCQPRGSGGEASSTTMWGFGIASLLDHERLGDGELGEEGGDRSVCGAHGFGVHQLSVVPVPLEPRDHVREVHYPRAREVSVLQIAGEAHTPTPLYHMVAIEPAECAVWAPAAGANPVAALDLHSLLHPVVLHRRSILLRVRHWFRLGRGWRLVLAVEVRAVLLSKACIQLLLFATVVPNQLVDVADLLGAELVVELQQLHSEGVANFQLFQHWKVAPLVLLNLLQTIQSVSRIRPKGWTFLQKQGDDSRICQANFTAASCETIFAWKVGSILLNLCLHLFEITAIVSMWLLLLGKLPQNYSKCPHVNLD
mmetsp:Transcript_44681/g.91180  ORF Transcript_44681/g.91180 Transcript_44681/m.91180 type:complete len:374 (+) Transcript_44681:744-1865(+)